MDNNAKKKKAEKAKEEEAALNRILCWIVGGTVLWALVLFLNRYLIYYKVSEHPVHVAVDIAAKILAVAGLVCAAGAGYWWNNAKKSGRNVNMPATLCLFMAGASLTCFAAWTLYDVGLKIMNLAVPVVVVLAVVEHLYQREFFLICCQSVLALLGIWLCDKGLGGSYSMVCYAYVALAALLLVLSAFLCRKAQGNQGEVELGGKRWELFSKDTNYGLLYAGAVVALVTLIVAAIGISSVVLYAVSVAWFLIMMVYYTVKLM